MSYNESSTWQSQGPQISDLDQGTPFFQRFGDISVKSLTSYYDINSQLGNISAAGNISSNTFFVGNLQLPNNDSYIMAAGTKVTAATLAQCNQIGSIVTNVANLMSSVATSTTASLVNILAAANPTTTTNYFTFVSSKSGTAQLQTTPNVYLQPSSGNIWSTGFINSNIVIPSGGGGSLTLTTGSNIILNDGSKLNSDNLRNMNNLVVTLQNSSGIVDFNNDQTVSGCKTFTNVKNSFTGNSFIGNNLTLNGNTINSANLALIDFLPKLNLNNYAVDMTTNQSISGQKTFTNANNSFTGNFTGNFNGNVNGSSFTLNGNTINSANLALIDFLPKLNVNNYAVDMTTNQSISGQKTFTNSIINGGSITAVVNVSGNMNFITGGLATYNNYVDSTTTQPGIFIKGNVTSLVSSSLDSIFNIIESGSNRNGGYIYFRNAFFSTNSTYTAYNANKFSVMSKQINCIYINNNVGLTQNYLLSTRYLDNIAAPIYQYYNVNIGMPGGGAGNVSNPILFFPDPTADFVGVEITLIRSGTGYPFRLSTVSCNSTNSTFMMNPGSIIAPYFGIAASWNKLTLVCTPNFDSTTSPYVWNQMYYQ